MLESFAINEERVLALAGLFQATALTQQLANKGCCDAQDLEASLQSVLRLNAPSVIGVYGQVSQVRLGLRTLIKYLDNTPSDLAVPRMTVMVLRLERRLNSRRDLRESLQQGILSVQRQVAQIGHISAPVISRMAQLYSTTLSTLRPRIMVNGNPQCLNQDAVVEKIRACLLAAIRSAVLWRQVGGRQWQLLLHRRTCCMLARGLLTGTTLESG